MAIRSLGVCSFKASEVELFLVTINPAVFLSRFLEKVRHVRLLASRTKTSLVYVAKLVVFKYSLTTVS